MSEIKKQLAVVVALADNIDTLVTQELYEGVKAVFPSFKASLTDLALLVESANQEKKVGDVVEPPSQKKCDLICKDPLPEPVVTEPTPVPAEPKKVEVTAPVPDPNAVVVNTPVVEPTTKI